MKKIWLFTISSLIALSIAYYSKNSPNGYAQLPAPVWKTFEKKSNKKIVAYKTTPNELAAARISEVRRDIAQEKNQNSDSDQTNLSDPRSNHYLYREERVLIGDIQKNDYQDEKVQLEMLNKISSDWKEILGNDLIRFQSEFTKVMIKEELPVIKIQNGKGQYLEQVIVTYIFQNGNISSYRALVDSESGSILETWDKSVHEKSFQKRAGLSLPSVNNSGIITR